MEERALTPFGGSLKEAAEDQGKDFEQWLAKIEEGATPEERQLNSRALYVELEKGEVL